MKKRTFKNYLLIYGLGLMAILVFSIFAYTRKNATTGEYGYLVSSNIEVSGGWANEFTMFGRSFILGIFLIDLSVIILMPALLSFIIFLMDYGRGRVGKKTPKEIEREAYEVFVGDIGSTLNQTHKFNVEDFRHFRESDKFQNALQTLYKIYLNGETEENSYFKLIKKFQKGTKERDAVEFLVTFTEKKRLDSVMKEKEKEEVKDEL